MSCLDVPRLHFKGHFNANPSTINNTLSNYTFSQGTYPNPLVMSWDAYGDATFSIDAYTDRLIGKSSGTDSTISPAPATAASIDSSKPILPLGGRGAIVSLA